MNDRNVRILEIITSNRKIKVNLLAELLDVSQVTLRRDLDILEDRGIIRRTHGYATLDGADDTGKRLAFNYSIKKKIAKSAVQTIEEGETIMVESGSCCALFAEEIVLAKKNITIITNSIFIKDYIYKLQGIKIIFLGGYFQPESQVMVGPLTLKSAENIFIEKFFLGTDGYVPEQGFTGRDYLRVETAYELAKRANKVFILTESDKFYRRGSYSLLNFESITGVFTDDKISKEAENTLRKHNIQLNIVPSVDEKNKWRQFPGQSPVLYKEKEEEK